MKVVAINASCEVSGAESVLKNVLAYARECGYDAVLACPPGPLAEQVNATGLRHLAIPAQLPGQRPATPAPLIARLAGLVPSALRERTCKLSRTLGLPVAWLRAGATIAAEARDADLLLANSTFALPSVRVAAALLRLRGRRVRTAWIVHDTITSPKQALAVRLGAPALTLAVAVSEATARSVRPLVRRVEVEANGVDVPARPMGTTQVDPRHPVVGILAVITEWKGQLVAIEALASCPGVELEIAGQVFPGSEEYAEQLHARAARPDVAGRVRFLGHARREDVFPRWSALLSPSIGPEAGPLGVLEAMAHGVPVIATDHGGSSDYLSGGCGVLVPPGDAGALASAIREVTAVDPAVPDPGQATAGPSRAAELRDRARRVAEEQFDITQRIPAMWKAISGTHGTGHPFTPAHTPG